MNWDNYESYFIKKENVQMMDIDDDDDDVVVQKPVVKDTVPKTPSKPESNARKSKKKKRKKQGPSLKSNTEIDTTLSLINTLSRDKSLSVQDDSMYSITPETIGEYKLGTTEQIFIHRLKKYSTLADPQVCTLPPLTDVLSYVAQLQSDQQPPWFIESQKMLVENGTVPPDIPVLYRQYIMKFMVQYTPSKPEFKPCCQTRGNCQSEILSKGKFRLRALMLPNSMATSNPIGELCYLCHLHKVNIDWVKIRDQQEKKDLQKEKYSYYIHDFVVEFNKEGEYKLEALIPTIKKRYQGIIGPFPLYNEKMYRMVQRNDGLWTWVESDKLVFRLSQVESGLVEY